MYIESIELKNYRNYDSLSLQFDKGTNIFYGDNAQGKTNILEAVYLCGTTKSHRGSKDREMIQFDADEAHIRMFVKKEGISRRIDMHLKKNKTKGIAVDGIPIRKAGELFGILNLVFFSPEDLNIIKNGPGERRRFMDLELCQLNKLYLSDLSSYNHVLNQRNKLLKDLSFQPSLLNTLDVWDEQLARYGASIIQGRKKFIEEMNGIITEIHRNITGGKEEIRLLYEPSVSEENFLSVLLRNREKDCRFKLTSEGPHRDDLCVKIILNAIGHQLLCIGPLIPFIIRPAARQKGYDKGPAVSLQRPHIAVTCIRSEPRLPGQRPFHHFQEGIMIIARIASGPVTV